MTRARYVATPVVFPVLLSPLFLCGRKASSRPETLQRCGRLISWLNIMAERAGERQSLCLLLSFRLVQLLLYDPPQLASASSFFSASPVSRERSKSHFPLSQTVRFFPGNGKSLAYLASARERDAGAAVLKV